MDFKTILEGKLAEGVEIDEVIKSINTELPKSFIPKEKYNGKADELRSTVEKMEEIQGQLAKAATDVTEFDKLKETLLSTQNEFETFKLDADKRVLDITKKQTIGKMLLEDDANKDAIDLLVNGFNLDDINIDVEGGIVGWADVLKPIRDARPGLFAKVNYSGADPHSGANPQPQSYETRYKQAKDSGNNLEAIKIKQQAAKENVYLL